MEDDMKTILEDMLNEIVKKRPEEYRTAFQILIN